MKYPLTHRRIAAVWVVLLVAAAIVGGRLPLAQADDYSGPLTITKGGTYSGNWRGTTDQPAVYINTSDPVTLENCSVTGPGDKNGGALIQGAYHKSITVTVRNCSGYGYDPGVAGNSAAVFFGAESSFNEVHILNNYLEGTGGMRFYGDPSQINAIVDVRFNIVSNIDGRVSGGGYCGGTQFLYCHRNFVGLFNIRSTNIEVAWNQVINTAGESANEDLILNQGSGGTEDHPLRVHDNYIQGAYNHRPNDGSLRFTGSAINIADPTSDVTRLATNSWAYDNQVVNFANYGIGLWTGYNNRVFDNHILTSNQLPDGSQITKIYVGLIMQDLDNVGPTYMHDNVLSGNLVGDTWVNQYGNRTNNCIINGVGGYCAALAPGNSDLNDPTTHPLVTTADEAAEFQAWQTKLSANSITLGPTTSTPTTTPTETSRQTTDPAETTQPTADPTETPEPSGIPTTPASTPTDQIAPPTPSAGASSTSTNSPVPPDTATPISTSAPTGVSTPTGPSAPGGGLTPLPPASVVPVQTPAAPALLPAGAVASHAKVHAQKALPKHSAFGQVVKWKSKTPGVCKIVSKRGKPVLKTLRVGNCKLKATANANRHAPKMNHTYKVRVK